MTSFRKRLRDIGFALFTANLVKLQAAILRRKSSCGFLKISVMQETAFGALKVKGRGIAINHN
jgi:hypothetical protein